MKLRMLKIKDIHPYERNARKNDQAVDAVAESIEQCSYVAPIVVDENHVILAGHTRWKAMKKLGRSECECIVKEGLTDDQKKKYRLLDNKTNELAEWDFDMLADELEGLDFGDLQLDWGVGQKEPDVIEDNYDPVIPEDPKSKMGQVYQLGRHRLMCGDSTNSDDVAKLMNGELADMLLTDPPYNVALGMDETPEEAKRRNRRTDGKVVANDKMEDEEFREFLRLAFFSAKNSMKQGAAFHIWHADTEGYNFRGALRDCGLQLRQCLVWVKNCFSMGRQDFQWQHEPCLAGELEAEVEDDGFGHCLYGWTDGSAHKWNKNRRQATVLYFDKPTASKEHPTMKPILLFNYEMQCNTQQGDSVLDLFGGSGTTIMAAEQNGRTAYVMEFDPKYVDVIIDRWEKFTGGKAVLLDE